MSSVEKTATSAAFFVRYHARTGLGAPEENVGMAVVLLLALIMYAHAVRHPPPPS